MSTRARNAARMSTLLAAALALGTSVASARDAAVVCGKEEPYGALDFWVGEWDVKAHGDEKGDSVGSSQIEKVAGGCAILERWGAEGMSWNFFDVGLGKWRQIWIDAGGRKSEMAGSYRDGAMRLEGEVVLADGRKWINRMTFFDLGPNRVRQVAERSTDGGVTWTTTVDLVYLRRE